MKMKQLQKSMLLLPYQGDVGTGLTKSFKRNLDKQHPNNVKTKVIFTGQKISNQLNIKDMTKFQENMMLFILENVQNRTALTIIMVNLLGEFVSKL